MAQHMKACVEQMSHFEAHPEVVITTTTNIFGKPLTEDDTIRALRACQVSDALMATLSLLLSSCKILLERQLHEYLSGKLSRPNSDEVFQASSAPVHNIWAERCLGMVDAQIKRAPNATIAFIDAKVKCKANNTLEWLDGKPAAIQASLMA